jgi:hypothetical protein
VELWFDGRFTLCLSEPIVIEYQRVLREIGAVSEAEERALIEAFASGEGVLYTADPPAIMGITILTPRKLLEEVGEVPEE